jgi:hypothetical protein
VKTKPNYVIENFSNHFLIKENKTDQYIISYDHKMHASSMCSKLNKGSGFEGETPAFMTNRIAQINTKDAYRF